MKWDKELVDACTARMVNRPASLDTLVATNLHADVLSDSGGRAGRQPGDRAHRQHRSRAPLSQHVRAHPRFRLRHHGQGLANPVGTFWSCVVLLEHLGENEAAARLMKAIEEITADPEAAHRRPRRRSEDRGRDRGGDFPVEEPLIPCGTIPTQETNPMKRAFPPGRGAARPRGGHGPVRDLPDKNVMYWQAFPPAASRTCRRATSRWC